MTCKLPSPHPPGGGGGVSRSMLRAAAAGRLCKAGRGARSGAGVRGVVATLLLLSALSGSSALAAAAANKASTPAATPPAEQSAAAWRARRGPYFKRNWGVEIIGVKPVASGYMLAFRYRILDPDKAKVLNDRKAHAYLVDEATGIALAVPALENVGELRPGAAPQADRSYFMVFGNPGKIVKSGSRVTLVAGNFRAEGLIVD